METMTNTSLPATQKELIFDNMSDAVLTIDNKGKITYLNSTGANLFEADKDGAIGELAGKYLLVNPKNVALKSLFSDITNETSNLRGQEQINTFELWFFPYNGEKKYLQVSISYLYEDSEQQKLIGFLFHIVDITDHYQLKQHIHDCAHIFAGLIICISLYLFTWSLLRFTLKIYMRKHFYTLIIEGISFLLFFDVMFFTSINLRDLGIIPNWKNFGKNIISSTLMAVLICGVLILAKVILQLSGIEIKGYFLGGSLRGAMVYVFTALIQEFLARGVMQTCVKSLMQVKYQKQFGVVLTSLLFSLMHLPFGFVFMMSAFAMSLILGHIYESQGDFWGCVLIHWAIGYTAMCLYF